jgi:thioredoxin 1
MSESQETDEVEQNYRLYDFMADWCGPCQTQGPIVEEFAEEHPEVEVQEVDVDENSDLANRFSVQSLPTLVLIEIDGDGEEVDGGLVDRWIGVTQKDEIASAL